MHLLQSELDDLHHATHGTTTPCHRRHLTSKNIRSLMSRFALSPSPLPPPPPEVPRLAAKVSSLLRFLRTFSAYYKEELASHEYADHPHADQDRARLRSIERIREEIVRLEIAPACWLEEDAEAEPPYYKEPLPEFINGQTYWRYRDPGYLNGTYGRCLTREEAARIIARAARPHGADVCHGQEVSHG